MRPTRQRAICAHDKCDNPECQLPIGRLVAVGHINTDTGKQLLFHIGCAPVPLRKAYYDGQRHGR